MDKSRVLEQLIEKIKKEKGPDDGRWHEANCNEDLDYIFNYIAGAMAALGYGHPSHEDKLKIYDSFLKLDHLEDNINEEFSGEVEWAGTLIKNKTVPSNIFNTFEWTNVCAEQLKHPKTTFPYLSSFMPETGGWEQYVIADQPYIFDDNWRLDRLESLGHSQSPLDSRAPHKENGVDFNPVDTFLSSMRSGQVPEPEILLSIAKAFDLYFSQGGELSLEDVFFGQPSKKKGNYSQRSLDSFKDIDHKVFEFTLRRKEFKTVHQAATHYLEQHQQTETATPPPDFVDSFLRKHRRWKELQGIAKSQQTKTDR